MSTVMTVVVNKIDSDVDYQTTPANYVPMDLTEDKDYLIWTSAKDVDENVIISDGDAEPTEALLNEAATIIDPDVAVDVEKCFVFDYSDGGGKVRLIDGMGVNKQYVFGFSFDGATASEPQLEAWDNTDHDSTDYGVLGDGTPANSWIKAICTTLAAPGSDTWAGSVLAGANELKLNNGNGALAALGSGLSSQELYCNLRITIIAGADPAVEPFVFTVRYTTN